MDKPKTADIIIIGGGVIGVSIAFHLARMRAAKVVLVERKQLAGGASGLSSGLVRMHYDNPIEAEFAFNSFDTFRYFDEIIGGDCGFVGTGFVRIPHARNQERLRANVGMLQDIGIDTYLISGAELGDIAGYLQTDDISIAAYEPQSGYADPYLTTVGIAQAAKRHGAQILQGVEVIGIDLEGGRVRGVETSVGYIAAPVVVNAAGPWGSVVAAMAGIDAQITPFKHQATLIETPSLVPSPHLTIIDRVNGVYLRPETGRLSLTGISGGGQNTEVAIDELDGFGETPIPQIELNTLERLYHRLPAVEASAVRKGHVGVEGYTSDGHALLGPANGIDGFYMATGLSGHGFKEAPAVGQAMAELILNGKAEVVDITPLRPTRFAEGQIYEAPNAYQ
ncbi:MAG: FAD-binding oxidoreductase [Chloroflexi bacterium]|nr:FAD-binding oxidoreductase [Chloroflexota bacterium]